MKGRNKLTALVLLVLLLSLFSAPAFAAPVGGTCGEQVTWLLEEGVLTVSGRGAMEDYAHGQAPWYHAAGTVTAVVVESGVTRVGDYAFADLAMSQVSLPDGLQAIGSHAFSWGNFTDIHIPDTVTTIGHHAFEACLLERVTLPAGLARVEEYLFNWCDCLKQVDLGAGTTWVAPNAFAFCTALETIHIDAEEGRTVLDVTTLPAGVTVTWRPATGSLGDGLTWVLENGVLTVSGVGETGDGARCTRLLLAAYDGAGRMCCCTVGRAENKGWIFALPQDPEIDCRQLFRLDDRFAPVGDALPLALDR